MSDFRTRGASSQKVRVFIPDNTSTSGAGLTGLTYQSTNLTIAYKRAIGATVTYTGANIEDVTTVGTFEAPSSSSKCRFKAVDATSFPGLYEIHIHDSATAFGTADASDKVQFNVYEATTTALKIGPNMKEIQLTAFDLQTATQSVNVSSINSVAATSVTTINANIGQTQPINFTGTAASALVKSDLVDVAGAAVNTSLAQLGVNAVNAGGQTVTATKAVTTDVLTDGIKVSVGTSAGQINVASGKVPATIAVGDLATNSLTAAALATDAVNEIASGLLDTVNTAAAHNVANSVGRQIRQGGGGATSTIYSGTARAGSTSNTIVLPAAASATNSIFNGDTIVLTGGVGAGQTRRIVAYNGTTKVATVDKAWVVTPTNTSTFDIVAGNTSIVAFEGVATGGSADTVVLPAAASASDGYYSGFVVIESGTGSGQSKEITGYTGGTRTVSIAPDTWTVNPSTDSVVAIMPQGDVTVDNGGGAAPTVAQIAAAILADPVYPILTDANGYVTANVSGSVSVTGDVTLAASQPNYAPAKVGDLGVVQTGDSYAVVTDATYGLSAVKALIDTITNRIGAFTGTGINTVLGFFKAVMGKAASNPSDLGALTFDAATDSLEGIKDTGLTVSGDVTLASTQPNYAPAKAGDKMDLVDAPNALAVGVIQSGLSTFDPTTDDVTLAATQPNYAPAKVADVPTTAQIADKVLGRNLAGGADGTRTVQDALRAVRNKVAISGGIVTVYEEDDSTPAWTGSVTTHAGDPIISVDPS